MKQPLLAPSPLILLLGALLALAPLAAVQAANAYDGRIGPDRSADRAMAGHLDDLKNHLTLFASEAAPPAPRGALGPVRPGRSGPPSADEILEHQLDQLQKRLVVTADDSTL